MGDGAGGGLRGGKAAVGNAGERVGQHQAVNAPWMDECKAQRIVAADRLPNDMSACDVQMIEQRKQVVAEHGRIARRARGARQPEAAQVGNEASVASRQRWDLLPPAQVVAAAAMHESDAGALAVVR